VKTSKVLFIAILSFAIALLHPSYAQVHDQNLMLYPSPTVELKYLNDLFTKELIIKRSFRDNERVPIRIELIKPQMNDGKVNDLYGDIAHSIMHLVIQ